MSLCFLMQASFKIIIYKNNQPSRCHTNCFHRSRGPTLKGFTKGFYRKRKPTFSDRVYCSCNADCFKFPLTLCFQVFHKYPRTLCVAIFRKTKLVTSCLIQHKANILWHSCNNYFIARTQFSLSMYSIYLLQASSQI